MAGTTDYTSITEEEVIAWMEFGMKDYTTTRLTEILNGNYSLDEARADILRFRRNENNG